MTLTLVDLLVGSTKSLLRPLIGIYVGWTGFISKDVYAPDTFAGVFSGHVSW